MKPSPLLIKLSADYEGAGYKKVCFGVNLSIENLIG